MWKITTKDLKIQAGDWVYYGPGEVIANIGIIQFNFDTTGHPIEFEKLIAEYRDVRITFLKWNHLGWTENSLGLWAVDFTQEVIEPEFAI